MDGITVEEKEGMGMLPYFMWNGADLASNVYYGANFVDYIGYVNGPIVMVRPMNGKNYDSFIFNQYFDVVIDGEAAADATTLQAIEAIKLIPEKISLNDRDVILAARAAYDKLNVDDRPAVTNLEALCAAEEAVEAVIKSLRPEPTKTVIFNADDLMQEKYTSTVTEGEFTLVATSDKAMDKKGKKVTFTYADVTYSTTYGLSLGGKASFGKNRYLTFTTEGACTITIATQSSGSDARTLLLVDSTGATVGSYEAGTSVTVTSIDVAEAGTYSVGSAGSGIYIYVIIIEYFE
jgi:hypothetical protein